MTGNIHKLQRYQSMAIKKYINTREVAELTGQPYEEIVRLARTGVLPSHKTRRGHYRLNVDAVEKCFGIQINKPEETVDKPKKEEPIVEGELVEDVSLLEEEMGEDGFLYIQDKEHITTVFKKMTEVRKSLKIATGDLKNFNVRIASKSLRICDFFNSLVERGVRVQVVCMEPEKFFIFTKKNCPHLLNNSLFELRQNKHSHMKIFIFDDESAYIGSANITSAAIGTRYKNHEAGFLVWGENMMKYPAQHFESVWYSPDTIKTTWKRFTKSAKKLEKLFEKKYGK